MQFIERDDGDFRIYTGAIEARSGDGYLAAVVVHRLGAANRPAQEVYRDDALCAGYAWPTPDAALSFAMRKASGVIRAKQVPRPDVSALPEAARAAAACGGAVGRRRAPPAPRLESAPRAFAL